MSKIIRKPEQIAIAEQILEAYEHGYDDVWLEAPTGSGKSGIAYFVSELSGKSAGIVSHQKVLQDQYAKLFSDMPLKKVVTMKGKNNYKCQLINNLTVDKAPCSMLGKRCGLAGQCEYQRIKENAVRTQIVNTNYQLIYALHDTGTFYFPKDIFIYDECHMIPSIFTDYRNVLMSTHDRRVYEKLSEFSILKGFNHLDDLAQDAITYLNKLNINELNNVDILKSFSHYYTQIKANIIREMSDKLIVFDEEKDYDSVSKLSNIYNHETNALCKYENLQDNWESIINNHNYVIERNEYNNEYTASLVPLDISTMYPKVIDNFSEKCLYMSSTIFGVDNMKKELGTSNRKSKTIILDSNFPVENRKIFYIPLLQLNNNILYNDSNNSLDSYFDTMFSICENHYAQGHSGFISAPSYKMCSLLLDYLKSPLEQLGFEVLYNTSIKDRDSTVDYFRTVEEGKNKILISPSFYEGVNFSDDISRFQIISKIPFKSLGSEYVKARLNRDKQWYNLEAVKQIVQCAGRSVRSKEDFAMTYIIDSNWGRVFNTCRHDIPKWFKDAIENVG